jgi:hypothetical protein
MDFAKRENASRLFWNSNWLGIWKTVCPSMGPNGGSVAMDSNKNSHRRRERGDSVQRQRAQDKSSLKVLSGILNWGARLG